MNPYSSYKESGIELVGKIPSGWDTIRIKYITSDHRQGYYSSSPYDDNGYRLVRITDINDDHSISIDSSPSYNLEQVEYERFKLETGDFLFPRTGGVGRFGVFDSTIESIYGSFLIRFRFNHSIQGGLLKYLFESDIYLDQIKSEIHGGVNQNVHVENIKECYIPIISITEQQQISNYLDDKTQQIDSLIEKTQQKIELLKEKILEIVINEQIDGRGEFERLRYLTEVISRPATIIDDDEYVALGLYNRGRGLFHKPPTLGKDMGDSSFSYVEEGDLILSGQFAWEGAVTMASNKETGCVVSHRYPVIRGKSVATEYLLALLMTDFGDFLLNECSRGAAGRNRPLNIGLLLNEKIRIPSLEVQNEIRRLMYLRAQAEKKSKKSIGLLKEYRQSLISEVVTGKIDVREEPVP